MEKELNCSIGTVFTVVWAGQAEGGCATRKHHSPVHSAKLFSVGKEASDSSIVSMKKRRQIILETGFRFMSNSPLSSLGIFVNSFI